MWSKHRSSIEELNVSAVQRGFGMIRAVDLSVPPLAHRYHQPSGDIAHFITVLG